MPCKTAHVAIRGGNPGENARLAVEKLRADFRGFPAAVLLFFASPETYDPQRLAAEIKGAFPGAKSFGCASGGEMTDSRLASDSLAAMAFSHDVFETAEIVGVEHVDGKQKLVDSVFGELEWRLRAPMRGLDHRKHFGLMLLDPRIQGIGGIVERTAELTDVIFAGGCASDRAQWSNTVVFHEGKALPGGAVFALFKPRKPFRVLRSQSIADIGPGMVATSVDTKNCVIREFDGKPAAQAYAEAIGATMAQGVGVAGREGSFIIYASTLAARADKEKAPIDSMNDKFMDWPLVMMANGEPLVRAVVTALDDGGLQMYAPPVEGVRYSVARTRNVAEETRKNLDDLKTELGGFSALINVNCMLREVQMRRDGDIEEFAAMFRDFPTVGFSSYGEIYVSLIEQSSILFAIGQ